MDSGISEHWHRLSSIRLMAPTCWSSGSSTVPGVLLYNRELGNILRLSQSGYTPVIQIQVPGGSRERREVIVPQRSYIPYHRQNYFDQFTPENPITFSNRSGQEGIALTDVMNEYFDHLLGRDDPMFPNYKGPTISLRLEVSPT